MIASANAIKFIAVIAMSALCFSTPGHSETDDFYHLTGNQFLNVCTGTLQGTAKALCFGYVKGLADGLALWRGTHPSAPVCFSERVTGQQLLDVGLKYVAEHPETRDQDLGNLLGRAFFEVWPCRR